MKQLDPNPSNNSVPVSSNKKSGLINLFTTTLAFSFCLLISGNLEAQYVPGNPGNFGIDGDIFSDARQQGSFTAAGSHDWFYKKNGTGLGLFDTSDSTSLKTILSSGTNYSFSKRMQYDRYSVQNGQFYVDALYARDYFGNDGALDKTVFNTSGVISNKNSQNPATWTTVPTGALVPSKSDIIDAYVHMRRDGNVLTVGSPSNLILNLGASLVSTLGDHYIDFELFKNEVDYNTTTGAFPTAGPASTAGRNIWEFNADGSVKSFGEMSISYSFNNSTVTDISIYIWVPLTTFKNVVPMNFTFTSDWNQSISDANFGYAKILPKTVQPYTWAAVSNVVASAPAWGTTSKDLGAQGTNYYSANYGVGQFAEAAIDLTLIGVDPLLNSNFDNCTPPYKRVMIKTRSSSSFSSALQDFAGPFEFSSAPKLAVNITTPAILTCSNTSVQLSTDITGSGLSVAWTTLNGNIVSGSNTNTPVINKPGDYIVTTSAYSGCYPAKDTITVYQDIKKPVAKILTMGVLTNVSTDSVTLKGGDTTASKYTYAYSSYQGLTFNWSGPNGFTGAAQNVKSNTAGTYSLIVTEISNGCKDTATDVVLKQMLLPITLKSFSGKMQNTEAKIEWTVDENQSGDHFELQSSVDGAHFNSLQTIPATQAFGTVSYTTSVPVNASASYYRLIVVNRNSIVSMSKVILLDRNNIGAESLQLLQNPVQASVKFNYNSLTAGVYTATIYNANGVAVKQSKVTCSKGMNRLSVELSGAAAGNYILAVSGQMAQNTSRFIKM